MGSSSTSWSSESNTHAGSSQVYNSSTWSLYSTTSGLRINAAEGQSAQLELWADEGDDSADKWKINVADGGTMTWQNNSVTKLTLGTDGALSSISAINGGIVFNEVSADVDFRIESDGQTNMFLVDGGNNKIGIGKVPVDGILEVKGQTASSPVISVDGSATNGFIMMADNYVAGESQYSTGVTQSGAATYIASRVHTATDQAYTHADGWKSSTDAGSYRGCAIVLDGNTGSTGGSISLYYGHSDGTVAVGSTKALTRGFILRYDGKVGIGADVPIAKLDVRGRTYFGGPHYMGKTNVTIASGVLDISSTQGPYIAAYAEQGVGSNDADTITSITIDGAEPATGSMIYLTRGANDVITLTLGGSAASTIVGYWADDVDEAVQTGTSAVIGSGYQFAQLMYTEVGRWVIMNPGACQFNVS